MAGKKKNRFPLLAGSLQWVKNRSQASFLWMMS